MNLADYHDGAWFQSRALPQSLFLNPLRVNLKPTQILALQDLLDTPVPGTPLTKRACLTTEEAQEIMATLCGERVF